MIMIKGISGYVMMLFFRINNPYPALPTQSAVSFKCTLTAICPSRIHPYPVLSCSHLPLITLLVSLPVSSDLLSLPPLRFSFLLFSPLSFLLSFSFLSLSFSFPIVSSPFILPPFFSSHL